MSLQTAREKRARLLAAGGTLAFIVAALLPVIANDRFTYHLGILIAINALLALSMHAMLRIDQLSLAQAAFMGLGAYASALLTRDLGLPFTAAFLAAGFLPALLALALGPILLRLRGVHFVLLTFALGEVIVLVFVEWVSLFGGNNGLMHIPAASLFGHALTGRASFYLFALTVVLVVLWASRALLRGSAGLVIHGLAHNEALIASLGVDALPWRCVVFAFGAFVAGLAGSLYAHYLGFISPEAFGFWSAINALIMNVLGGASLLLGPVFGAMLLVPLPELFRESAAWQRLYFGLTLLLLMLFLPQGLGGWLARRGMAR